MAKRKYKVKYIAKDGAPCSYTFKSDRRMCVSARGRSAGMDFGFPWHEDAAMTEQRIMEDEGSAMSKHGGVRR
ncbi:hypothetical protein, partial [Olsenella sp. HMSC062G07]|uniref:hypothetical protein n=1 Tax=Olsenella sp. HMSC062G07 TaxID=1739330 RepID=UPI0011D10EC8